MHDAQYDYYGRRLAVCSSDGIIEIYDVTNNETQPNKIGTIKAHNGPVWQVAWGHPKFGSILASCGFDKKIIIWQEVKPSEWHEVHSSLDHQASVNSIVFAPWECGLKLAGASSDGKVSVLCRKSDNTWEKPIIFEAHKMGVNSISWAPLLNYEEMNRDISIEQYRPLQRLVTGSCDATIKVWEYDSKKNAFRQVNELRYHKNWVRDVAWCPNIGSPYDTIASCGEDGVVVIWNSSDRQNFQALELDKFEGPVWRVSWSVSGNMLAISSATKDSDNNVYVYRENEQGKWEIISKLDDEGSGQ